MAVQPGMHSLEFNWNADYPDTRYQRIVGNSGIVRGELATINITLTNRETINFPGGIINSCQFVFYGNNIGNLSFPLTFEINNCVPTLAPNQSHIIQGKLFASLEGYMWFTMNMSANDGNAIIFNRYAALLNQMAFPVQVVNRELVRLLFERE